MNPGTRTNVLPAWLLGARYDEAASDRAEGVYLFKAGFRRWEWFVHTPGRKARGWFGWASTTKQAWHNSFALAAYPDGITWIDDGIGFPG